MRLLMGSIALAFAAPASAASISEAQSLYDRNQLAEAERAFAAIAADAGAPADDRSRAERALAKIAWLIDADAGRSLEHLAQAQRLGGKPCDTALLTARVLTEAKRDDEALRREASLLQACPDADKRDSVRAWLIAARLNEAMADRARSPQLIADAAAEGEKLSAEAGIEGARMRLEAALLSDRPEMALAAWKDYFWLDDADAPQALAGEHVAAKFADGLRPGATVEARLALADLLMRAGFAQASRRYADAHGLPAVAAASPTWRRLQAYWSERDRLEAILLRVNRGLARGQRDEHALDDAAKQATVALMAAAGASGDPRPALRKYYGLVGTVGKTGGYPSIHMGHVIEDHEDRATQYTHSAAIHFIAIDNMIANGFESWLWDGSAMVGGWTSNGVIVHVRSAYVTAPAAAYRLTRDGSDRRDFIARQAGEGAEDIVKLKARPVATLAGLNDRLHLQLVDQIDAAARSRAGTEAEVRRAFLAEYWRANLNQSILVHEGRHAIDETLGLRGKVDQAVLEYRAKLSELALTAYPRMALSNMNRSLEGDGPHDRAGARVFDEYRKWMEGHKDQIMGYDPAVPVLAQLDKLTDGQIREIARGLDPLARGDVTAEPKL